MYAVTKAEVLRSLVALLVHRVAAQYGTFRSVARYQASKWNVNNTSDINKDNYQDSLYGRVTIHDQQSWRICIILIQTCLSLQGNVSIGLSIVRQAKGALKYPLSYAKFSLQVAGVGQRTHTISQKTKHTAVARNLSLSLSLIHLTHTSLVAMTHLAQESKQRLTCKETNNITMTYRYTEHVNTFTLYHMFVNN